MNTEGNVNPAVQESTSHSSSQASSQASGQTPGQHSSQPHGQPPSQPPASLWRAFVIPGVLQGIGFYWLSRQIDDSFFTHGLLAITLALIFIPIAHHLTTTREHGDASLIFSFAMGTLCAVLTFWSLTRFTGHLALRADITEISILAFACSQVIFVITIPFFIALVNEQKPLSDYSTLFKHAWSIQIIMIIAHLFILLVAVFLTAGSLLLNLVGIDLAAILYQDVVLYPLIGGAFGAAFAIARGSETIIHATQNILLILLKFLLPFSALITGVFVFRVVVAGVDGVDPYLVGITSILLTSIFIAIVLINATVRDHENPVEGLTLFFVRCQSIILPLLAACAIYGLWLRVNEYGLTHTRILAMIVTAFATLYSVSYAVAAFTQHSKLIFQKVNTYGALLAVAVSILLMTPALDVYQIAVSSQRSSLENQEVAPEKFDFEYLAQKSGQPGRSAILSLSKDINVADYIELPDVITRSLEDGDNQSNTGTDTDTGTGTGTGTDNDNDNGSGRKDNQPTTAIVYLPLEIPPVILASHSAGIQPQNVVLNLSRPARSIDATLIHCVPKDASASFTLPAQWTQHDADGKIKLQATDDVQAGLYTLALELDGKTAVAEQIIDYTHIKPRTIGTPAVVRVQATNVSLPDAQVGYVGGGNDRVGQWLQDIGLQVIDIDDAQLSDEHALRQTLSTVNTLVIGVFAYRMRKSLARMAGTINQWVHEGGHLLTLYHRPWDNWNPDQIPPSHLEIGQPSLRFRVTDENARVEHLQPSHAILNTPNIIGPEDWHGWHKERGLYFAKSWADEYLPLIRMSDPEEQPHDGALLCANIGHGRHVHTSLILHHQMEHLVPGAFRIMANLVS